MAEFSKLGLLASKRVPLGPKFKNRVLGRRTYHSSNNNQQSNGAKTVQGPFKTEHPRSLPTFSKKFCIQSLFVITVRDNIRKNAKWQTKRHEPISSSILMEICEKMACVTDFQKMVSSSLDGWLTKETNSEKQNSGVNSNDCFILILSTDVC